MRRLVAIVGDVTLAERFQDLEDRLPARPPVAPAVIPPLLHNLDAPIAEQLWAIVRGADSGPIDDLLLLAPFYDDDAAAVERLLNDLKPRRVRVYVTSSTSVNGDRLATHLAACDATVEVAGFEPDRFVHAKLVGVIAGHRAWLLSGSANLSQAALTRTPSEYGNVELAVLAPMEPTGWAPCSRLQACQPSAGISPLSARFASALISNPFSPQCGLYPRPARLTIASP